MKRILLALTLFVLFLPMTHQASAQEVSVDFFYNNLGGGSWIDVEGYGYGWQPAVATSDPNWRPYADGYWAYTDVGWTWVSYEDFGWATYHYGRWARLADYGWVWFPGDNPEWGPAWVSWRHGGGVVGWAPLPPRGPGIAFSVGNIGFGVDVEYDIGPAYYNFVDVRYIGEPVLRDRIFAPTQNVTYINQTVNVTNITTTNNVVYNYGPDYNTLSAQSSRPIQRLKLERQQNADPAAAVKSGAITKVQGSTLVVGAPARIQKPTAKLPPPPTTKAKVAQPKIEKGWAGVANEAELKQKMKTEDHKNIPPPTGAAATGRAAAGGSGAPAGSPARAATSPAGAATSPAGAATSPAGAAAAASPVEKGKARGRHGRAGQPPQPAQPEQPAATAAPAFSPATAAPPTGSPAGKHKGRPGQRPGEQPGASPAMGGPVESPAGAPSPRGRSKQPGEQPDASPATGGPAESPAGAPSSRGRGRGLERGMPPGRPEQPPGAPEQSPGGKRQGPPVTSPTPHLGGGPGAGAERPAPRERMAGPAGGPGQPSPSEAEGARHKPPGVGARPSPAGEERGAGKAEGGKEKKEASPTPAPY